MTKLKKIFDSCDWRNKFEGTLPESEGEILYRWREHEAAFAELFFGATGSRILRDDDLMVERSLHYAVDEKGRPTLVVRQVSKPIGNLEGIAATMAMTMDPTKVQEALERCGAATRN